MMRHAPYMLESMTHRDFDCQYLQGSFSNATISLSLIWKIRVE